MTRLTRRHREMLAFEAGWWRHTTDKAAAIRDLFSLTEQRYSQILAVVIDWPEAMALDPLLIRRLRRDRARRHVPNAGQLGLARP